MVQAFEVFTNPIITGIVTYLGLVIIFVAIYSKVFTEQQRTSHQDFLIRFLNKYEKLDFKRFYIKTFKRIDKRITPKKTKGRKWKIFDKSFYTYKLFFFSLLYSIIPTVIVSIMDWNFQIVGPIAVLGAFSRFSLREENIQEFNGFKHYFNILMLSTFTPFAVSSLAYIFKNYQLGLAGFYVASHSILFGFYCLIFIVLTVSIRILIHKCSYDQQVKQLFKTNIKFLLINIFLILVASFIALFFPYLTEQISNLTPNLPGIEKVSRVITITHPKAV